MMLTYKVKHNRDFSEELRKAQKIAEFCIKHQTQKPSSNPPPAQKTTPSNSHFSISSTSSLLSPSFSTFIEPFHEFSTVYSISPILDSLPATDSSQDSGSLSPEDVKHIGLKSIISGQILRKYSQDQKLRSAKNVKLIIFEGSNCQ